MTGIRDICEYKFISGLTFSPDGKNAGFIVHKADYAGNKYVSHIWVYNKESGKYTQLTSNGEEREFWWLDNNTLIFSGLRNAAYKEKVEQGEPWTIYYTIDINGGEAVEFCKIPLNVTNIEKISGSLFALTATYDNNAVDLHGIEGDARLAAIDCINESKNYEIIDELPFYFDGVGYTSKKRSRLYLFDAGNNKLTPITCEFTNVNSFVVKDNRILYSAKYFTDFHDNLETGLYMYDISNGESSRLLDEKYIIFHANFVKDEIFIVGSLRKDMLVTDNPKFYFVRDGGITLWHDTDFSVRDTVGTDCTYGRSADFRMYKDSLYLVSTYERSSFLTKVPYVGEIELLTADNGSVDAFDFSGDDIYFVGLRGTRLQEIYLNGSTEIQVSAINNEVRAITPETMRFENNGYTVHYVVLKPAGFDPSKKYPAIMYIHGGAKVIYGTVFFHEMQLLASQGYFVVYGNPRGSDGQGSDFARLQGNYGVPDYSDMMKAMDVAIEQYPQIDAARLGVAGGSYGGIMTNWIIGHTNRFKCAIAMRSICNMISTIGTADNGTNFVTEQMGGDLWNNLEGLWRQSPLAYAHKVKTPLLLLHSDKDYRCHYTEAFQMFSALKYHGVDSRICLIRGENHNLSRGGRPRARIKRLEEILSWFSKYLSC
ncbi:MAG: S9 family peptidase [Defluviitaleaceae bacterium]|nr:S9 family peptidase [Defluviitaleaceae bacterium]